MEIEHIDLNHYIIGDINQQPIDVFSQAGRVPVLLLVDASRSTRQYSDALENGVTEMITAIADHPVAGRKVDLEVVTFAHSQIHIRIPAMEIQNLVDRNTRQIKPEYLDKLRFDYQPNLPTGYALAIAMQRLSERYQQLKNCSKSPKCPVLFVVSGNTPLVSITQCAEHDRILHQMKEKIKNMVQKNQLISFAAKVGWSSEPPQEPAYKRQYDEIHQLMQDITGLPDDSRVYQAGTGEQLKEFFHSCNSGEIAIKSGIICIYLINYIKEENL